MQPGLFSVSLFACAEPDVGLFSFHRAAMRPTETGGAKMITSATCIDGSGDGTNRTMPLHIWLHSVILTAIRHGATNVSTAEGRVLLHGRGACVDGRTVSARIGARF
jgi:hypothetical protein